MSQDVLHPGKRIKAEVIPGGMSVTKAAELLGVSRPTLSNLLNGNAALSSDMAIRLEKAFGTPRAELMDMQARYEESLASTQSAPASAQPYVPPYLQIKANDIEAWASGNLASRARLAVFLRTLVHSTGGSLAKVDFPGNDDAERPGWDGFIEVAEATPWIPEGLSGWEFGVNKDVKTKADGDYDKSIKAIAAKERRQITFVFVTPRRWPGKAAWIQARRAEGRWKDVRAYDASDLEQWLEQSIAGQAWFANEIERPSQSVRTLDKCWKDWAGVASPPLVGALFTSAIEANLRVLRNRILKPAGGPIIVAADSAEEALAFLAQAFDSAVDPDLGALKGRVLVFDQPGVLPRLVQGAPAFIPVASSRAVEREMAPMGPSAAAIAIYPRNVANPEPDIVLEPAGYDAFKAGLEAMGKDRDTIDRLDKETGRSLTVLRRRLATVNAVRTPGWATDKATAAELTPFLFVGAWNTQNESDKVALERLIGGDYPDLERASQRLAQLDDTPVWSIGTFRGCVSKIDLLFAIADVITAEDLAGFYAMAKLVLGEDDPALDLPEKDRWASAIYGKSREFSAAFRSGVCETLVLLAVHGKALFKARIGVDTELEAIRIVRDLLPAPLTARILEAQERDLPTYAEAAPDEFLSIIERDLRSDSPVVLELLRPVDSSGFGGHPSRTGLLWALEGLAWSPRTLTRAVMILARLAEIEIKDNWVNKPIASLRAIFRAWMPQTAADLDMRVALIKQLAVKHPKVAWTLCMDQFGDNHRVGHYSHKPRWRPDGYGFGEPSPTWGPIHAFQREVVEMALTWSGQTLASLTDLVDRLSALDANYQARVWALVETWSATASDADKAALRDKIRTSALSRRGARLARESGVQYTLTAAARTALRTLEPRDVLNRHAWLFKTTWVDWDAEEVENLEEYDHTKREEKIRALRLAALREVVADRGAAGIFELARLGEAGWAIGLLSAEILTPDQLQAILFEAAQAGLSAHDPAGRELVGAALHALAAPNREALFASVLADLPRAEAVGFFFLAPFSPSTWSWIAAAGDDLRVAYWQGVPAQILRGLEDGAAGAVEQLLEVSRPLAAFAAIRLYIKEVDPELLFQLLSAIAKTDEDVSTYRIDEHTLVEAFKRLNSSTAISLQDKALLEWAWLEGLARGLDEDGGSHIPNLERLIESDPTLFIQAIIWAYKRADRGVDPGEVRLPEDRAAPMAEKGYKLLRALRRVPGHDEEGKLDAGRLGQWIHAVRKACADLSRLGVADVVIGQLLARAPADPDGQWPCRVVCDVVEEFHSEDIAQGMTTAVFNMRGATWRGPNGDQERALADKYRRWGEAVQVSHPFVAAKLLFAMAATYDHDAEREDLEAGLRRRLH